MRNDLWRRLQEAVPGIRLNGHPTERLPNTLNVLFPGVSGNAVLAALPEIAASTGAACHAEGERTSAVLLAMGLDPAEALGAVRLSLGKLVREDQIPEVASLLADGWQRVKGA